MHSSCLGDITFGIDRLVHDDSGEERSDSSNKSGQQQSAFGHSSTPGNWPKNFEASNEGPNDDSIAEEEEEEDEDREETINVDDDNDKTHHDDDIMIL